MSGRLGRDETRGQPLPFHLAAGAPMIGTALNAAGIVIGGVAGLKMARPMAPATQSAFKSLLGVATVFVGLRLTWISLGGGLASFFKQFVILVLALILGRIAGRLLHLQKGLNRVGQFAKESFARAAADRPASSGEGFVTCALLFALAPLGVLGAVQDGLASQWQALAVKAVMDGLGTMAFARTYGWSTVAAALPVLAFQGTVTLGARAMAPWLAQHGLIDSVQATGGMLVFCVSLIVLEFRKVELADYLPSLAFAPLLTWLWR